MKRWAFWALGALVLFSLGCGRMERTSYNPVIDPANFVAVVTNRYFPLVPGTVFTYIVHKDSTTQDVTITVTHSAKVILGVTCTVVHDLVKANGQVVEDTLDWYAQDKSGDVWYFGEDTKKYEGSQVSTKGTWEAGVDGAKPGMIMEGNPRISDAYRQEYLAKVAEDRAEVLSLTESATVPSGTYRNCLKTKDYSDLEPGTVENKVFYPNVGQVLTVMVKGGNEREELVSITHQ